MLHENFYYNLHRENKNSTVFRCRQYVDKKQCSSTFTLKKDGTFTVKEHTHDAMENIQSEIMIILQEINKIVVENPTQSIKNIYDQKEVELVNKFGAKLVAEFWPEFDSKDSALFVHKNKLVPKLPKNIDDLKDLPEEFKTTTAKKSFLVSPIDMFNKNLLFASLIGLTILANSDKCLNISMVI